MAPVKEKISEPLSTMEWCSIGTLLFELSLMRCIEKPSNEEQVVIDWISNRISYLESRKG
jgi:hypothetical protein